MKIKGNLLLQIGDFLCIGESYEQRYLINFISINIQIKTYESLRKIKIFLEVNG